jgi:Uma2 family endonuclease
MALRDRGAGAPRSRPVSTHFPHISNMEGRGTVRVVLPSVAAGELLRIPMSREDYLALGETECDEWYDGMRVVNPPTNRHQMAAMQLAWLLKAVLPAGEVVLVEAGWRTEEADFRPDIQVVPAEAIGDSVSIEPPLLVVEVLSPSNREADLVIKRAKYARAGLPWYWVVDLVADELVVFRNEGGELVEVQRLRGGSSASTVGPYVIAVDPATLDRP